MAQFPEEFPVSKRPAIIRARGKSTMLLLIKMLKHFKVPFSILHDSDKPKRKDGKINSAWSTNESIYKELEEVRKEKIKVIHRISVPNIELAYLSLDAIEDTDKPWTFWQNLKKEGLSDKIKDLLIELCNSTEESQINCLNAEDLKVMVLKWATMNNASEKLEFS
jgi:putative ATP-dependent endonuclease of the OLD family